MSIIDKENNVWKAFIQFRSLFETEARELGIDVFGTDKIESVATSLTIAHFLEQSTKELKKLNDRGERMARRDFHIKNTSTFKDNNGKLNN